MADSFETVVKLGEQPIRITTDSPNRLLQLYSYFNDLNQAAEGRPAIPFYRSTKDGYEYYGLRDEAGVEVTFGQQKKPNDPDLFLFAYRPGIDGYKGWNQYNGMQIEQSTGRVNGNRVNGSHVNGEQQPNQKAQEVDYGKALLNIRKRLQKAEKAGAEQLDSEIAFIHDRIRDYPAGPKKRPSTYLTNSKPSSPQLRMMTFLSNHFNSDDK